MGRPRIRPQEHLEDADDLLSRVDDGDDWLGSGDPIPPGADRPEEWPSVGREYGQDLHGARFWMGPQLGWSPAREGRVVGNVQRQPHATCTVCGGPGGAVTRGSNITCAGCLASDIDIDDRIAAEVVGDLVAEMAA